jgi:hypothetical protein
MLVIICFIKLIFWRSLSIPKAEIESELTIWRKHADCQSGIREGEELVIVTPISNPSEQFYLFSSCYQWSHNEQEVSGSKTLCYVEADARSDDKRFWHGLDPRKRC